MSLLSPPPPPQLRGTNGTSSLTRGVIRTGMETVPAKTLETVSGTGTTMATMAPASAVITAGTWTREGRSASGQQVRVGAGVAAQSKIRGSAAEGRSVVVTAGPYKGLVGEFFCGRQVISTTPWSR